MPTFEVDIDDYDLEAAGYVREEDLPKGFGQLREDIDFYYFRNNIPKDNVYMDIMEILGDC